MGERVDAELEGFEAGREIFDAVELVSPRARRRSILRMRALVQVG
jgi:hypothetical protein